MKVILVYNTSSGGRSSLKSLRQLFNDADIEIIDAIKIEPGFESLLKKHIQQGRTVAVVGGDGSISAVANLLVNTKATLMPLPGGTLNHFTKDLGIPQSLPEALHYFKSAKKIKVDTGKVGDEIFVNNSSIGIYSDSLVDRDVHAGRYGKWPAVIISLFTTLFRFRTYHVQLNGKMYVTPLVFIGNNKYEPNAISFTRNRLDEGTLSVYMIVGKTRLNLFLAAMYLALGRKNVSRKLKSFTTNALTISTRRHVRVSRDGEHERLSSPLKYSIQPSSLIVLKKG